jgi:hypothetical protein
MIVQVNCMKPRGRIRSTGIDQYYSGLPARVASDFSAASVAGRGRSEDVRYQRY